MEDKSLLFRRRIRLHRATGVLLVQAIVTSCVDKYVQMFVVVTAQLDLLQNLTSYCASGIRTRNLLVMSQASYRCYYRAIIKKSRNDGSIISFLDSIVNHLFQDFTDLHVSLDQMKNRNRIYLRSNSALSD